MENFQLYRTNILLGGQMKWDLILDTQGSNLVVSDFHLSPININYPKYTEENLLNYPHQENLKKYYKEHEGLFYELNLDPRLSHDYAIVSDIKEEIYEDSFEAGPKNGKCHVYNKTIEVFCPLWIEYLNKNIYFEITMFTETDKKIGSKTVKIDGTKFGDYFYNYIKYLGLDQGIDDVLDINFNTKKATITGIKLDSGNLIKQDISYLVSNLMYRERPMMEFDSLLINAFKDTKMIVRQLFNFNFCFDVNDLISSHLANMTYGNKFKFKVSTIIDDNILEIRDFYSNYTFIEKDSSNIKTINDFINQTTTDIKYNVLDYLYDYKYVNFINKNKYVQSVIHWSLNDNPNYLFNLYNGFGPYESGDDDEVKFYSHKYGNTPDLLSSVYNKSLNNIGWCSVININSYSDWLNFIKQSNTNDDLYLSIKKYSSNFNSNWINNIKYEYNTESPYNELRFNIFVIQQDIYDKIKRHIESNEFKTVYKLYESDIDEENIYCVRIKNSERFYGILVCDKYLNNVTYMGFKQILDNYIKSKENSTYEQIDNALIYLNFKLNHVKPVPLITLNKSLYITKSHSPSISSTEIEYYKNDDSTSEECYVLRYDGKIKPTFINKEKSEAINKKYFKITLNKDEFLKSDINKYMHSGLPLLYPSIGYYAINEKALSYDKIEKPIINLIKNIEVELYSEKNDGVDKSIIDIIKNYIKSIYKISNDDELNNIYNMYNVEYSYDYKSIDNIDDYVYFVKLSLK